MSWWEVVGLALRAAVALAALLALRGRALSMRGGEIVVWRDFGLNPLGARGRGRTWPERLPHYHRRGRPDPAGRTPPGRGIGRHRPWKAGVHGRSIWDRF